MKKTILFNIILFLAIAFSNHNLFAQKLTIEQYFSNIKNNRNNTPSKEFYAKIKKVKQLKQIASYCQDSIKKVRINAYNLINYIVINVPKKRVREKTITILIESLSNKFDSDTDQILSILKNCNKSDFKNEAKNKLASKLKQKLKFNSEFLKIIGWLNPENTLSTLVEISNDKSKDLMLRWNAKLALARMGDQKYIDYCVEKIKQLEINDAMIYNFIPSLIYLRNNKSINYCIELLYNNQKNCTTPNPDKSDKIVCGYRIMEYLAPIIKNYPLKIGPSGDIITKDYKKSLKFIREWFKNNNFEINTEIF